MGGSGLVRGLGLGLASLGAIMLILGCQVTVKESHNGAWVEIDRVSTLTLKGSIEVPVDRARVFFRDGRLTATGANLGPSCGIEIRTMPRDRPHAIQPGVYRVVRVQNYWTPVAGASAQVRWRLAQATDGGGDPQIQEGYHLWLEGPDANVMRLTCLGMLDDLWRARPPTLEEIRAALGDLATLELAQIPPG